MYFGRKRVETGPNCSHELANFLKYHMTLNIIEKNARYQQITDVHVIA